MALFANLLNIGGSEWMIIIFVALVLILGTGKLPGAAKKIGKVVSEYNKAKNEIKESIDTEAKNSSKIVGPVETEREKLEMIAKSIGVATKGRTDEEIREDIAAKMGQKKVDESKSDSKEKLDDEKNDSKDLA